MSDEKAKFIPADGAPIETAPEAEKADNTHALFIADPTPGDLIDLEGVPEGHTIIGNESIMVSTGFKTNHGDLAVSLVTRANLLKSISEVLDRVCFSLRVERPGPLSDLVNLIMKRHPNISDKLVLSCFELGNPNFLSFSDDQIEKIYNNWLELDSIVKLPPESETIFSAKDVEGHTTLSIKRPKLKPPHPVQFEDGQRGIVGTPTSGVMRSPAFGRKYGEVRREVMSVSDLMGRISTQFQRVAFEVGAFDSTHMEYLTMSIFEKCPDISHELVLSCLEVSTLAQTNMSREKLTVLLSNFYELVTILSNRWEKKE